MQDIMIIIYDIGMIGMLLLVNYYTCYMVAFAYQLRDLPAIMAAAAILTSVLVLDYIILTDGLIFLK